MLFSTQIITFLLVYFVSTTEAQNDGLLYYPSEDGGIAQVFNESKTVQIVPPRLNLDKIRGTSLYEQYVDRIISYGVSKLTLAVNEVLLRDPNNHDESIVFAPVGIAAALALLLLGSNGKTFEELSNVMGLATGVQDLQKKPQIIHEQFGRTLAKMEVTSGFLIGSQINVASAIFLQNNYPVRSVYKQAAEELYRSEIINLDFANNPSIAMQTINSWVSQRTNGKISKLLDDPPSPSTKVIITNALYFKAEWEQAFFEGGTSRHPFYVNGRKSPTDIVADMMTNGGHFPYHKDYKVGCEILGFPYKGKASTMYVVVPFDSNKEKLKQFSTQLTPSDLNLLVEETVLTDTVILFPKMKLESTIDLKDSLEALGVKSLFDPAQANLALISTGIPGLPLELPTRFGTINKTAQENECIVDSVSNNTICNKKRMRRRRALGIKADTLDNIRWLINQQSTSNDYQNPGLYADKIVHKVFMDITETGTEAAAATSITLSRDGSRTIFRVDVPFLFFIRHEATKSIIFWGTVISPTPSYRKT